MDDIYSRSQEVTLKIPVDLDNLREELAFFEDMAELFREYDRETEDLEFIERNIKEQIKAYDSAQPVIPDENEIIETIQKHPYFKNPCDYPIRLLTILKYLKSKGINVNYAEIDLYVDRLLQNMDDIKKVGRGLYMKKV